MRSNYRFKHLATLAACATLSAGSMLHAQGTNASVSGIVTDASGAAVANAIVVVKNTGTAATRTDKTDAAGRYEVTNLIPGSYEISAEAQGFSKKLLTNITLLVGQQATDNIALAVGQNTDTVSVEATETLTQTESSENGTVIENKKVVELPLANRQFYSLALLSPGAYPPAQTSTLGFRGGFNVAGATEETNLFTYNGTYDSSIGTQQPSYRPSIETIQEFKLLTGVYGPEYGKYSGAQIVVLEKQGSNSFHGSAYEFIRNPITNAKPYFTRKGDPIPPFRQNTFGGTVGGPIIKDKTFFFGGYEGQRVNSQNTQTSTIPSAQMLAGIFPGSTVLYNPYTGAKLTPSADGTYDLHQIPQYAGAAAKLGQAFAAYYPSGSSAPASGVLPTASGVYPSGNFIFSSTQIEKMNEWTVRLDHTINTNNSLHVSYQEFRDPTYEPANVLCGSATIPNGGCNFNQIVHLGTLEYDRTFTPNLLNTFTFGYNRFQMPRTPLDASLPNVPLLPGASLAPVFPNLGLPNIAVSGFSTLGGPTNIPQNQWLNQYNVVDAINWNHGAHSFKFGIEGLMAITTELFIQNGRGAATFNSGNLRGISGNACATGATTCYGTSGNSAADLLLGIPYTTARNPSAPNVHEGDYSFYGYFADNWKIKSNLTLNLGVRYEMNSPAYDSKNVISRFNPNGANSNGGLGVIELGYNTPIPAALAATTTLSKYFTTNNQFKYLYNFDWNNVAPRVGFAWQPYHKDSTVVKGAYGIFYNGPIEFNQYISASTQLPVRQAQTFTTTKLATGVAAGTPSLTLANPFPTDPANPTTAAAPGTFSDTAGTYTVTGYEQHQPTPYIHEWSLGVQQALTSSTVLELVYLGTHGTHLANTRALNLDPTASSSQAKRFYPQFGSVTYALDSDSSSYNSLQVKLQQTYKNGYSYLLAYTYGKSIDQNSGTGSGSNSSSGFQDPLRPDRDRGLSDFNIKHRIAFSPVLELPFGKGKPYLNSGINSAIFGGFQISGIFQFQTGRPFTIVDAATNTAGTFAGADRPNLVPGQDPNHGPKTVAQWFNKAAFALQPTGQYGNSPRNGVIGPQLTQLDATIAREFPIWERVRGQIRVEGFNVLNHPNFFNPFGSSTQYTATQALPGTQTNGAFGTIVNAYDARQLQGAIRIKF